MGVLEHLADEAEIRNLALRYAAAVDHRDADALQALFTRDVVLNDRRYPRARTKLSPKHREGMPPVTGRLFTASSII